MASIVLKTANRKTTISRVAVRKAVQAVFEAGSFDLKKDTAPKLKKAARKNAA